MPSKLRKALGAVKDQTSISLAKVSRAASNLDVSILRATSHDEIPVDDRLLHDVLHLASSSPASAAACVRSLARRISRTRNWVVALKSLSLAYRLLRDPDPDFAAEALRNINGDGARLLNLSAFRDDSTSSSPWDYTAFVRTFALYLDQRLDCYLSGKLHRSASAAQCFIDRRHQSHSHSSHSGHQRRRSLDDLHDMKPAVLLDKIAHWQKLLDRFIATKPTGPAKSNQLVQVSLYPLVRESFDLYRDISDGVALVLDNFFHLPLQACMEAFHICGKASKQFDELAGYYSLCKSLGMGRTSEYPNVQHITDALLETLNEFLKDNNHPGHNRAASLLRGVGGKIFSAREPVGTDGPVMSSPGYMSTRASSEQEPQTDEGTELDFKSALGSIEDDDDDRGTERWFSETASERHGSEVDLVSLNEPEKSCIAPAEQENNPVFELRPLECPIERQQPGPPPELPPLPEEPGPSSSQSEVGEEGAGWEMLLVESANKLASKLSAMNPRLSDELPPLGNICEQSSSTSNHYNPFLQDDGSECGGFSGDFIASTSNHSSSALPPPTFCAKNPAQLSVPPETDPFSSSYGLSSPPAEKPVNTLPPFPYPAAPASSSISGIPPLA